MVFRVRTVREGELLLVNGLSPVTEWIPSPQAGVNTLGLASHLATACSYSGDVIQQSQLIYNLPLTL